MPEVLALRVDAGMKMGAGHTMRCLALAQAWQEETNGEAFFLAAHTLPGLRQRMQEEGFRVVELKSKPGLRADAEATLAVIRDLGATWLVVDGYHFQAAYQRRLRNSGVPLLLIDDLGDREFYHADVILNQNLHATPGLYDGKSKDATLLTGTRYVLLRREFLDHGQPPPDPRPRFHRLVITLGGGGVKDPTRAVLRALREIPWEGGECRVVLRGDGAEDEWVAEAAGGRISTRALLDPPDMASVLSWADLAIAAAGTTAWELCYLGVPALFLSVATNQRPIAASLEAAGAGIDLGGAESLTVARIAEALLPLARDGERREGMARVGQALVDGQGAHRVLDVMRDISGRKDGRG